MDHTKLLYRIIGVMLAGAVLGYLVGYQNGKLDGIKASGEDPAIVLGGTR